MVEKSADLQNIPGIDLPVLQDSLFQQFLFSSALQIQLVFHGKAVLLQHLLHDLQIR